jgi:hypothetical protein
VLVLVNANAPDARLASGSFVFTSTFIFGYTTSYSSSENTSTSARGAQRSRSRGIQEATIALAQLFSFFFSKMNEAGFISSSLQVVAEASAVGCSHCQFNYPHYTH